LHFAYVLGHRQDGARLSASITTQKASVAEVAAEVVARNPAAAADDGLAVEWLMRNVGVDPEDASHALGSLNWSEKGIVVLPESIGDLTVDGHLSLPSDAATTTMPSNSRTFEHSPFRLIVDIAANELLTTVLDLSEKEDALAVSLACEPFHKIISTRYNNTGGVKTPVKGVVSSKARFSWVCNFPQSQQPKWLVLKKEKTADYIASGGQIDVMEFALDEHHGPFAYTNEEASANCFSHSHT